jgi:hypothetical protein
MRLFDLIREMFDTKCSYRDAWRGIMKLPLPDSKQTLTKEKGKRAVKSLVLTPSGRRSN